MTRFIKERIYVVIIAGGEGTRFVPYSTPQKPKQFLPVTHPDRTMIQETYERALLVAPPENCFVCTNARYLHFVYEQLPSIPHDNVIGEPMMKNTAPAIALMTTLVGLRDPDSVVAILPSDHFVEQPDILAKCLETANSIANSERTLVTLGIKPTHPSSQYGYIKCGLRNPEGAFQVEHFVEKPTTQKAKDYIKNGHYYWNSGMFIWRSDVFWSLLKKHTSQIAGPLKKLKSQGPKWNDESILTYYKNTPPISIDYALMEKTNQIIMVPLDAGWHDAGGWETIANLYSAGKINPPKEILGHLSKINSKK